MNSKSLVSMNILTFIAFLIFAPTIQAHEVTFIAYNAEMVSGDGYDARKDYFVDGFVDELDDTGADVLCLSEVFSPVLIETFVDALDASSYPYTYSILDESSMLLDANDDACPANTYTRLLSCLDNDGSSCFTNAETLVEVFACIEIECTTQAGSVWKEISRDTGCSSCIVEDISNLDTDENKFRTRANACKSLSARDFSPSFGQMIVSREPITNGKHLPYDDLSLLYGGALIADTAGLQISCHHLAVYSSWYIGDGTLKVAPHTKDIQTDMIDITLDEFGANDDNAVIAGDFNADSGGAGPGPSSATYQYMGTNGYSEVYTTLVGLETTHGSDAIIDHVFAKPGDLFVELTDAARVFDTNVVTINNSPATLSHHSGVLTVLEFGQHP
jgi:endonuclease/exonuclease/phosphatase family metal-dependent hydrolase